MLATGCSQSQKEVIYDDARICIVPWPVEIQQAKGFFTLKGSTKVVVDKEILPLVERLQEYLSPATGFMLDISDSGKEQKNSIQLKINSQSSTLGAAGYHLTVKPKSILIKASDNAGIFYGIQTLCQLLPVEIYSNQKISDIEWNIPCVSIEDYPRFKWRGVHLDVARHFMPKEFVKKFIDTLAVHKINILHWHLTDDQGWRIEIKKHPKLTQVGAWRKETVIGKNTGEYDGKPHGGYYSQDDIKEIVEYAAERYINIVPEIEMPGHCQAALACYPELSCTGGPFEVGKIWGIYKDVFCAGNEATFEFIEEVLSETIELFSSKYIHVGGDECLKTRWKSCPKCQSCIDAEGLKDEQQLQSWFVKRIERFLKSKDRKLIGWDEILEGGLATDATVMSWQSESGGITAAKLGRDVVMAPMSHTYFDQYQARTGEQLAIGGFLPLDKVYSYDPIPEVLSETESKHVLGVQTQLWSEYISTPDHMGYMAYPRACALAELAWTPLAQKDYNLFHERLGIHLKRLEYLSVNFRRLEPMGK
jgi:hexosaminidase